MTRRIGANEYLDRARGLESKIKRVIYDAIEVKHNAGELTGRLCDLQVAGTLAADVVIAQITGILEEAIG